MVGVQNVSFEEYSLIFLAFFWLTLGTSTVWVSIWLY